MSQEEINAMCIDLGSYQTMAGIAGDDEPKFIYRSVCATPREKKVLFGLKTNSQYIGKEAIDRMSFCNLSNILENGIVQDWDLYISLILNCANDLKVATADVPLLISEPLMNPRANREKMAQIAFEDFNSPAFYVVLSSISASYSSGKGTGTFIDMGEGQTSIYSLDNGVCCRRGLLRRNFGGRNLTDFLMKKVNQTGQSFFGNNDREIIRELKDKESFIDIGSDTDFKEISFELPDGKELKVPQNNLMECGELLFNPSIGGYDYDGIHNDIYNTMMKCDMDIVRTLLGNIWIFGGGSFIKNLQTRLTNELKDLAPSDTRVVVVASPERNTAVWIGESILASLSTFQTKWFTKDVYEEFGPSQVHKICHTF